MWDELLADIATDLANNAERRITPAHIRRLMERIVEGIGPQSAWYGKKIVWMGTSISESAGYPEMVAAALGATLVNISVGGGRVRAFKQDGSWEAQAFLRYQFTLSQADVDARYQGNLGLEVSPADYLTVSPGSGFTLTQAHIDALIFRNYEARLVPHLDADLFVFDYGVNDRNGQLTFPFETAAAAGTDRKYFAGAIGFLYDLIHTAKAGGLYRTLFVTHHSATTLKPNSSDVIDAQINAAKYYGGTLVNMAENLGLNELTLTDNISDNLHPPADGVIARRYAKFIVAKLKEMGA